MARTVGIGIQDFAKEEILKYGFAFEGKKVLIGAVENALEQAQISNQ